MHKKIHSVIVLLVLLLPMCLQAQVGPYDIHAVGENYKVSYLATPPVLEPIIPYAGGYNYVRWESSSIPLSGFVTAAGVPNTLTYTNATPLQSTTYYRRITNIGGIEYTSNTIKLEVVSINNENMNYIREHTVLVPALSQWTAIDQLPIGDKLQTTTYIDNIGRPLQKVAKGVATPAGATDPWGDAVQFVAYDAHSRKPKSYLPYTTTANAGNFKPTAIADQAQYYTTNYNETAPYSAVSFDNSPLNRATKVNAPGTSWAASAGNKGAYEANTASEAVVIYRIGYLETDMPVNMGIYPAASLIKTTSTDENGKKVVEYINKSGQLISKKVQLDELPADNYTGWICTYNVYDDFGQLRFQIQPEAVKWLTANGWSFTATTDGRAVADNLCFVYAYDAKGRNTYKKTPGAKPLYMVYDGFDGAGGELVFTQDGNQRAKATPEWTYYEYDKLHRPIKTSLYLTTRTRQNIVASPSVPYAEYTNPSIVSTVKESYYDDYTYPAAKPFTTNTDNALAGSIGGEPIAKTGRTLSMPTGSKVRVLNSTTFLINTIYYDERGRAIQTNEDNIKQGTDVTTMQYDYSSKLLNQAQKHTAVGTAYIGYSTVTKYSFDKLGRVTDIYKKFGTNAFKHISNYAFDDMGRLKKKRLAPGYTATGKTEIETLNYSFNIHGQLTGINKNYALKQAGISKWDYFFGQYLGYDNADGVFNNAQLDGHITGNLWTTQGDNEQRKYDYTYDNAGRLTNAYFAQKKGVGWVNTQLDFTVTGYNGKIEYDLNGNMQAMLQKGMIVGNSSPVNIDDLRYTYQALSNKLLAVLDNSTTGTVNGKLGDFVDGANSADDYVYDDNGNLVIDLNKNVKELNNIAGANGIIYNFLDKPEQIRLKGKGLIKIVYDADGNKLQKIFTPESGGEISVSTVVTTTYINGFVYKNDKLQFISFEEGRLRIMQAVNTNNNFDYVQIDGSETMPDNKKGAFDFFIRDYQSNVRMVLTEETHTGSNICTMEIERAANEEPIFGKTDINGVAQAGNEVKARFSVANIPGQSLGSGWTNSAIKAYVSKLQNLVSKSVKVGPNSLLKVMAGDKVSATTIYFYKNPVNNAVNNNPILTNILTSLTNAISTSAVASDLVHGAAGNISSSLNSNVSFANVTSPDANNPTGNNPRAYLTVLFFDERFNFVGEGSTTQRVQGAGNGQAPLVIGNVKAPKNGYAYIYISNESVEPVYFDNLRVVHERGRIVEENHYYAYGLKIAGISSVKAGDVNEGELKNRRQYQGAFSEYDEDIQWNDFALRNYDPQIARWVQQDPYQQFASPYVALGGDPVNMIDPSGGWSLSAILGVSRLGVAGVGALVGAFVGGAAGMASGDKNGSAKGAIIGAFAGLSASFMGGGGSAIGQIALQAIVGVGNQVIQVELDKAMQANIGRQMQVVTNTGMNNLSQMSYGKYGGNHHGGPNVDISLFAITENLQTIIFEQGGFQKLSAYEIELLKKAGWSHHDKQFGSKMDLYKDSDGDVYEADKEADKTSEYEHTGFNIKNGKVTVTDFSKAFDLPKSIAPIKDNVNPIKFFDRKKLKIKPPRIMVDWETDFDVMPPINPRTVPVRVTVPEVVWPRLVPFEPIFFP
jgi:RHS repeat-associated protein